MRDCLFHKRGSCIHFGAWRADVSPNPEWPRFIIGVSRFEDEPSRILADNRLPMSIVGEVRDWLTGVDTEDELAVIMSGISDAIMADDAVRVEEALGD